MVSDSVYWERTGGHGAGELNYRLSLKMFCISHSESREQKNKIVPQICRSYYAGCVCTSLPFVFSCVLSSLYRQVSVPPPRTTRTLGLDRVGAVIVVTSGKILYWLPRASLQMEMRLPCRKLHQQCGESLMNHMTLKDRDLYFGPYMPALLLKCWLVPLGTKLFLSAFESPNSAKYIFFCLPKGILWYILHFIGLDKNHWGLLNDIPCDDVELK